MRRLYLAIGVAAFFATSCVSNTINTIQAKANVATEAVSEIRNQFHQRADLIPNLVERVRSYARQDSSLLAAVGDAGKRLSDAVFNGSLQQIVEADRVLTPVLDRLMAVSDSSPELKSNPGFIELKDRIGKTAKGISIARLRYNAAAGDFNATIQRFPYNVVAKQYGLSKPREYFEPK